MSVMILSQPNWDCKVTRTGWKSWEDVMSKFRKIGFTAEVYGSGDEQTVSYRVSLSYVSWTVTVPVRGKVSFSNTTTASYVVVTVGLTS